VTGLALLVGLLGATNAAAAEARTERKWTVQVDPLTVALGYPHLQVERALADHWSVYLGPHARLFDGILTEGSEPYVGFGAEAGVRWFPWGGAPEGAWLMGRTVASRLRTTDNTELRGFGGYASVLAGYTGLVLNDRLVLSGGLGYNHLYYGIAGYGTEGPFIAAHTALGVAF
jgi:hypothetical protein